MTSPHIEIPTVRPTLTWAVRTFTSLGRIPTTHSHDTAAANRRGQTCYRLTKNTKFLALRSHHGVQKIDQRGTIFTKLSQICAYADDNVIVARTQKKLTEVYLDLEVSLVTLTVITNA
jgi:hypothetical protein